MAIEKWEKSSLSWILFAKFVAIYPEETRTLLWIFNKFSTLEFKDRISKNIGVEILSLFRNRESNLSPDVKKKLVSVSKKVTSSKLKLRHILELIIQGNIQDLDNACAGALQSMEDSETEYLYLLRTYPSCRFVARSYSRFKYDVCADHEEYKKWDEKFKQLQSENHFNDDMANKFGISQFPLIPFVFNNGSSIDISQSLILEDEKQSFEISEIEEQEQHLFEQYFALRTKIDSISFPGFAFFQITVLVLYIVFFLIPVIFLIIYSEFIIINWCEPLEYLYTVARLRHSNLIVPTFELRTILEENNLLPSICSSFVLDNYLLDSLANSCDIHIQFSYHISKTVEFLQNLAPLQNFNPGVPQYDNVRNLLFEPTVEYTYIDASIMNFYIQLEHFHSGTLYSVLRAEDILRNTNPLPAVLFNRRTIVPCTLR